MFPEKASAEPFGKRQFFTQWKHELAKDRYLCYYAFKPDADKESFQKQIVVFYPGKAEYTYFFNLEKKRYWGRCVTKRHDAYRPDTMVWSFAQGDGWGPLTIGDPKIPGAADGATMASPPDPPGL